MCFGYLWITGHTGKEALLYKKEKKKTPNMQLANHKLFKIKKNEDFTLANLNSGYFDSLMDAISIQDSFKDTNVIQYVFLIYSLLFSYKKLKNFLHYAQ